MPPTVIVTGASRGLGLAVTQILLQTFHANVITISRSSTEALQALGLQHPNTLINIQGDVTDPEISQIAIKKGVDAFSSIDGLILNAGSLHPLGKISDGDVQEWKALFGVNFFSLLHTIQASIPYLRKSTEGGKIVLVSSGAAEGGTHGWGAYNTSKAAMNSLCRTLASEETNIVSVALRPGVVDTDMQVALRQSEGVMLDQDKNKFLQLHSTGKLLLPEEPGHVIAALALKAPLSLSGRFISWNEGECDEFRLKH